jgi:hypothetical protein
MWNLPSHSLTHLAPHVRLLNVGALADQSFIGSGALFGATLFGATFAGDDAIGAGRARGSGNAAAR